jgi:septal ring factor EnvC (AmiA/AmiB activator)
MAAQRKPSEEDSPLRRNFPSVAETLRLVSPPAVEPGKKDDEKISVFWRIFGGTILSIVAMLLVTVWQQMSSSVADLRNSVSHVQEAQADFIKKDDVYTRCNSLWTSVNTLSGQLPEIRTRSTQVEDQVRGIEREQKELLDRLQKLSERLAKLEGQHAVGVPTKVQFFDMPKAE